MGKEGLTIYEAQKKRISFIEKALREDVLGRISESVSERNQNIALVYNLNEEITAKKVGEAFPQSSGKPLCKQRIAKINSTFLERAWENSSPYLQSSFPLQELLMQKPLALKEANLRIKKLIAEGKTMEIIRDTESANALVNAQYTLGRRGIEIPSHLPTKYECFKAKVKAETDCKKLQKLLNNSSRDSLLGCIYSHKKDEENPLTYLKTILKKSGFYPRKKDWLFAEKFKKNGLPIRNIKLRKKGSKYSQTYRITFRKCEEKIIEMLNKDPELQCFKNNPVRQVCAKPDKAPTTTHFRKGFEGYSDDIRRIIRKIAGIPRSKIESIKVEDFLSDCPVPVYAWENGHNNKYIYPTDRTEEMKAFLKSKRAKI
jgi:hypothetical protein